LGASRVFIWCKVSVNLQGTCLLGLIWRSKYYCLGEISRSYIMRRLQLLKSCVEMRPSRELFEFRSVVSCIHGIHCCLYSAKTKQFPHSSPYDPYSKVACWSALQFQSNTQNIFLRLLKIRSQSRIRNQHV
jgi:hypothetical protein